MMKFTYSHAMSSIAAFLALGGTGYAAANVTGAQVKDGSSTGRDVRNSSVTGVDVRDRSLRAGDFAAGELPVGPAGPAGPQGCSLQAGAERVGGPQRAVLATSGALGESAGFSLSGTATVGEAARTLVLVCRATGPNAFLVGSTVTAVRVASLDDQSPPPAE